MYIMFVFEQQPLVAVGIITAAKEANAFNFIMDLPQVSVYKIYKCSRAKKKVKAQTESRLNNFPCHFKSDRNLTLWLVRVEVR